MTRRADPGTRWRAARSPAGSRRALAGAGAGRGWRSRRAARRCCSGRCRCIPRARPGRAGAGPRRHRGAQPGPAAAQQGRHDPGDPPPGEEQPADRRGAAAAAGAAGGVAGGAGRRWRSRCAGCRRSRWCTRRCRCRWTSRSTSTGSSTGCCRSSATSPRPGRRVTAAAGSGRSGCWPPTSRRRWSWCSPSCAERGRARFSEDADSRDGRRSPRTRPRPADRRSSWRDDGRGLPEGFALDASDRLGLQIVRTLVEAELRGAIDVAPAGDRAAPRRSSTSPCPPPLSSRPARGPPGQERPGVAGHGRPRAGAGTAARGRRARRGRRGAERAPGGAGQAAPRRPGGHGPGPGGGGTARR